MAPDAGPLPRALTGSSRQKRAVLAAGKGVEQIGKEQNQAALDVVSLALISLPAIEVEPQVSCCLEVGLLEVGAGSKLELGSGKRQVAHLREASGAIVHYPAGEKTLAWYLSVA